MNYRGSVYGRGCENKITDRLVDSVLNVFFFHPLLKACYKEGYVLYMSLMWGFSVSPDSLLKILSGPIHLFALDDHQG